MWKFVASVLLIAVLGQLQVEGCPIKGQVYKKCGSACPPTCANPYPFCKRQCVSGCECPQGTVLDIKAEMCVPLKECSTKEAAIERKFKPPINCAVVLCAAPDCPNPITPPGQCCPVCPKPPINCAVVLCAVPDCPNPITPPGQCCPVCPKPGPGRCPIKGQVYQQCGTACPPTCADPYPSCTRQCVPGCQCPQGTVLDEIAQKCVRIKECTCPPDCTHSFCSQNPKALCNVPGPREIPGCFGGQCQLTYCPACYYAKEPRPLPGNCPDCGSPVTSLTCLRNWAACIRIADMWQYGSPDPALVSQEYFKCYRYPCKLRG